MTGFHGRRPETGRKVIILGAGAAGLAAALKLRGAGRPVQILEARTRPGGRIHTIRESFSDGLYAEAGAGRIPDTHQLTLAYVKKYDLALDPFWPQSGADVYFWRGTRQVVLQGKNPDLARLRVGFTDPERAAGFLGLSSLYLQSIRKEIHDLPEDGWPFPGISRYKNINLGDFLRGQGASRDAILYLSQGLEEDSLLDFVHDSLSRDGPTLWKIRGGNDRLPRAMAESLGEAVSYGAEVRRIEQDRDGVRIEYFAEGEIRAATADRIICTIPFPVLRDIEVYPSWSGEKCAAIREWYLSPVTRVFVQTRTRPWEGQGLSGFATVDQPMELWHPTHNQPGIRGILMTYLYESLAREYSAFDPQDRIGRTMDLLERVFPGVSGEIESATTWSWLNEPFSRGAFTITKAGGFPCLEHAAAPEGRVHFAGEHTSPWPCWIQGALHSGLRAAQEILAAG